MPTGGLRTDWRCCRRDPQSLLAVRKAGDGGIQNRPGKLYRTGPSDTAPTRLRASQLQRCRSTPSNQLSSPRRNTQSARAGDLAGVRPQVHCPAEWSDSHADHQLALFYGAGGRSDFNDRGRQLLVACSAEGGRNGKEVDCEPDEPNAGQGRRNDANEIMLILPPPGSVLIRP